MRVDWVAGRVFPVAGGSTWNQQLEFNHPIHKCVDIRATDVRGIYSGPVTDKLDLAFRSGEDCARPNFDVSIAQHD
ncbi:hypothetical protein GCM10022225_83230 [Plantactinospora mayteni]|uniref:Uncharacterized protein n=1 Tax=Plantactinospora mayteni TaxID=566021 RepID=A0ABQ4F4I5_9ACTN|nr:hypothetical protein Pma05_83750 [Plantactinospora mayteni]